MANVEINKYAEIIWPDPNKALKKAFQNSSLITFDWYQMKYISRPTSLEVVEQITAFAEKHGIIIPPYSKFDLSIEKPKELVDHFFMKRFEMSQAESFPYRLKRQLRNEPSPFVKAAVNYAVHAQRCFIADPDAVDRQMAALVAVHQVKGYPSLLICRRTEREAWIDQVERYLPDVQSLGIRDVASKRVDKPTIWLLDYQELEEGIKLPAGVKYWSIIVDHAHFVKNPDARRTQLVAKLANRVNYRFLVTDFPVNLSPTDLQELLHILGKESEFSCLSGFLQQSSKDPLEDYESACCSAGYQRELASLYFTLRSTCLVRRAEDPNLLIQEHVHSLSQSPIPESIDPDLILSELRWLGLTKVAGAVDWLRSYLKQQVGKTLIFAHHNDVVEELAEGLRLPAIYGKVNETQRSELVAMFRQAVGPKILIIANDVELAWNFGKVVSVVFVEMLITPLELDQITAHLLNKQKNTYLRVHYLKTDNLLDERAWKRLGLRRRYKAQIMDGR